MKSKTLSDNAKNGKRGERATLTPELQEFIKHNYGYENVLRVSDVGGSSCLNILLETSMSKYIVRVYRPYVTPTRLLEIQRVKKFLRDNGVPCPQTISKPGHSFYVYQNRLIEAEEFVYSDSNMDSLDKIGTAMPLLAKIHSLMKDLYLENDAKYPGFSNYIRPEDALEMTLLGCSRIKNWVPTQQENRLAEASEALARLVQEKRKYVDVLPKQATHGDFWHNNVLFLDGKVATLIDFDFFGERTRMDDLALTLYFTMLSNGGLSDATFESLRKLVELYNSELEEPLTRDERIALPIIIARQPLWSIGGWVALLDDEEAARQHASDMLPCVEQALDIICNLTKWSFT